MENSENRAESGQKRKVDNKNPPVEFTWKKGQSGNPGGPPKGHRKFKTILRKFSEMEVSFKDPKSGEELSGFPIEIIAAKVLELAMNGSDKHQRIYLEYLEGKALQQIEIINNETRYYRSLAKINRFSTLASVYPR